MLVTFTVFLRCGQDHFLKFMIHKLLQITLIAGRMLLPLGFWRYLFRVLVGSAANRCIILNFDISFRNTDDI